MTANLLMTQHEFAQQTVVESGLMKSLCEGLRAALAWDAPEEEFARKLSTVRFIFQSFQRHLERLMGLEEIDGYMDNVLATNPHLTRAVASLKEEHGRFRLATGRIAQELERISATDYNAFAHVCDEMTEILQQLDEHTNEEAKLFLEGFEQEEGGEG
jgi:hemerythrin-like domain-containing protein